jgi:hypothetical protein
MTSTAHPLKTRRITPPARQEEIMSRIKRWLTASSATLGTVLLAPVAFAQTPDVDITTRSTETTTYWYNETWVWAVGIGVFLIIIIALTARGRRA